MDENFKDVLTDSGEIIIDSLIDNELIKQIPVIGDSIKIIQGIQNIRDKAYLNKIKRFVEHIGEVNETKKKKLIDESRKDKHNRVKFGDALFTTIEQSDSLIKVEYTANAFEAFLNGDIEKSDLRHICHILKNSFTDELIDIVENEIPLTNLKYVVASGLAESIYESLRFDGNSEPKYKLSSSAQQLRNAWRKYNNK